APMAKRTKAPPPPTMFVDVPDATPLPHAPRAAQILEVREEAAATAGILAALDPDQRAAAEIVDGPLLIAAGPGSGKTRALTHRIAHLVPQPGARPDNCP